MGAAHIEQLELRLEEGRQDPLGPLGPVSALTLLARSLGVSVEELLGSDLSAAKRRGPAPKLQQQIERIQQLPRPQQKFVMQMIDTVLQQAGR